MPQQKPFNPEPVSSFNPEPIPGFTPEDIQAGTFAPGGEASRGAGASGSWLDLNEENRRIDAMTPQQQREENYRKLDKKLTSAAVGAVKGTGQAVYDVFTKPMKVPGMAYDMGKSFVEGLTSIPQSIEDFASAAKSGDGDKMGDLTTKFIFEQAPSLLGAGGIAEAGVKGAAGMGDARVLKARNTSIQNLSSAIQSGIKQGTGFEAASTYQPFVQSFLKKSGVSPAEILPKSADAASLVRGGSEGSLARLNATLKSDWVAAGKNPNKFVPHTDIHMAIADGAVNEAHGPIANAVRASRTVPINGTKPDVPNIQQNIIDALQSRKNALSPSQLKELGPNFEQAIADVQSRGGTIGGLDDIRRDWNSGMSRFHSGNPSAITAADANSAAVWNDGNNIIRAQLYPVLEKITSRPGVGGTLAEAGRREAVAIQARDGIYNGRVRSADMGDNVAIQHYLKYLAEGPQLLGRAVSSPAAAGFSLGHRILGRPVPMGDFNAALRKGIGDISYVRPMDTSAFLKRPGLAFENPAVQGPSSMVRSPALPQENVPASPIPFSTQGHPAAGLNVNQLYGSLPHEAPTNPIAPSVMNHPMTGLPIGRSGTPLPIENTPNPIALSPSPHPMTALDVVNRNAMLPHQGQAVIPASAPASPVGTGLYTGPATPSMPAQHPLMEGYSPVAPSTTAPLPVAPPQPPAGYLGFDPATMKQSGPAAPRATEPPKPAPIKEPSPPVKKATEAKKPTAPPEKATAPKPDTSNAIEALEFEKRKLSKLKIERGVSQKTIDWIQSEIAGLDAQIKALKEKK